MQSSREGPNAGGKQQGMTLWSPSVGADSAKRQPEQTEPQPSTHVGSPLRKGKEAPLCRRDRNPKQVTRETIKE